MKITTHPSATEQYFYFGIQYIMDWLKLTRQTYLTLIIGWSSQIPEGRTCFVFYFINKKHFPLSSSFTSCLSTFISSILEKGMLVSHAVCNTYPTNLRWAGLTHYIAAAHTRQHLWQHFPRNTHTTATSRGTPWHVNGLVLRQIEQIFIKWGKNTRHTVSLNPCITTTGT